MERKWREVGKGKGDRDLRVEEVEKVWRESGRKWRKGGEEYFKEVEEI